MADSGFAATRRTDKRQNITLINLKADIVKDLTVVAIAEGHILKLNITANVFKLNCIICFVFNRLVHDLKETLEACNTVLILLYEANQSLNRGNKQVYRNDEGGILRKIDPAAVKEQTACNEDYDVENVGYEGRGRMELCHGVVRLTAGIHKHFVTDLELFKLLVSICERLCDAYARYAGLRCGVNNSSALSALGEGGSHSLSHNKRNNSQNGNTGKNYEREINVDGAKVNERANYHNGADKDVFRAVVRKLADLEKVACKTG